MPATEVPGLGEIQSWAQFLGMDITGTVTKLQQLLETDPAAVRAGADQLGAVATGLDTSHGAIGQTGTDLLAGPWSGQLRDAFSANQDEVGPALAGARDAAGSVGAQLGQMATVFDNGHRAAITATGTAAAALRILRA